MIPGFKWFMVHSNPKLSVGQKDADHRKNAHASEMSTTSIHGVYMCMCV